MAHETDKTDGETKILVHLPLMSNDSRTQIDQTSATHNMTNNNNNNTDNNTNNIINNNNNNTINADDNNVEASSPASQVTTTIDWILEEQMVSLEEHSVEDPTDDKSPSSTNNNDDTNNNNNKNKSRFKWTKEKSQVAMNLVKHGCKPKLVSVAVGCSLRTAQKFVETVTPKIEGGSFKNYEIRRRGRKSKDVNQRLEAIREVLSKDSTKTQVEIAADLKVSNTTVCRDLKRIGGSWKERKNEDQSPGGESKSDRQTRNKKNSSTYKNKAKGKQKRSSPKKLDSPKKEDTPNIDAYNCN